MKFSNLVAKFKITVMFFIYILMVGCAGMHKDFVPLPDNAKQHIRSSKFVFINNQNELNAEVDQSNIAAATGGGLLFALVDSAIINSRAKETEKLLAPIRTELVDFDMSKEIRHAVFPVLKTTPWLHATDMTITQGQYPDVIKKTLKDKSITTDVVGAVSSYYTLSSNFNTLKVELALELYPLNSYLKDLSANGSKSKKQTQLQPIYRIKTVYNKSVEAATRKSKENAKLWALNSGQEIKAALKEAVANLALKLNDKLQNPHLDCDNKS